MITIVITQLQLNIQKRIKGRLNMDQKNLERLVEIEQRSKSNTKRLDEHDKELKELKQVYVALTKVNDKVENVESDVSEMKSDIKSLIQAKQDTAEKKGNKWDKLIDYLFYTILGACIAIVFAKIGLK